LARGETKNPDFTAREMKIIYVVIIKKDVDRTTSA
jgi:hypothetical protein